MYENTRVEQENAFRGMKILSHLLTRFHLFRLFLKAKFLYERYKATNQILMNQNYDFAN